MLPKSSELLYNSFLAVVARDGRVRCKGRLRTGSGRKRSSHKQYRPCAVGHPVVFRGDRFFILHPTMRLFIVANLTRPTVQPFLDAKLDWIKRHADLVGMDSECHAPLDQVDADAILVLGGDGTLLAAARRLGAKQIPLMGVNFGRLGFLANFTPDEFQADFHRLVEGELPITPRQILQVTVETDGSQRFSSIALNDAVVTAGAPYHLIDLVLTVDGGPSGVGSVH